VGLAKSDNWGGGGVVQRKEVKKYGGERDWVSDGERERMTLGFVERKETGSQKGTASPGGWRYVK